MAKVGVTNIIKLLKAGVDPKVFEDWETIYEDIITSDKEDAFYLIEIYKKLGWLDYIDLLYCALIHGFCDYIPELLEHCDEKNVVDLLNNDDMDHYQLSVFLKTTGRWDLCRTAILNLRPSDNVKYTFFDYLVTEKDYPMECEDVLPYIHALIDSLITLPIYVVHKIVDSTFHTHKYFEDWEIVSMIQLAKGEDTIYTNIPEFKDAIDVYSLTLSEQKYVIDLLGAKISNSPVIGSPMTMRYSMEIFWLLDKFDKLRNLICSKNNAMSKDEGVQKDEGIDLNFWYDHYWVGKMDQPDELVIFEKKYEDLYGESLEMCIYKYLES